METTRVSVAILIPVNVTNARSIFFKKKISTLVFKKPQDTSLFLRSQTDVAIPMESAIP